MHSLSYKQHHQLYSLLSLPRNFWNIQCLYMTMHLAHLSMHLWNMLSYLPHLSVHRLLSYQYMQSHSTPQPVQLLQQTFQSLSRILQKLENDLTMMTHHSLLRLVMTQVQYNLKRKEWS